MKVPLSLSLCLCVFTACSLLGQSSSCMSEFQLHVDPAARLQKPALIPTRLHTGQERSNRAKVKGLSTSDSEKWCVCVCVCSQCCSRTAARQLDRNLTFHKLVAYMIAFHTGSVRKTLSLSFHIKILFLISSRFSNLSKMPLNLKSKFGVEAIFTQ